MKFGRDEASDVPRRRNQGRREHEKKLVAKLSISYVDAFMRFDTTTRLQKKIVTVVSTSSVDACTGFHAISTALRQRQLALIFNLATAQTRLYLRYGSAFMNALSSVYKIKAFHRSLRQLEHAQGSFWQLVVLPL